MRTHPMGGHDSDLYLKVNVQRRKRLLKFVSGITNTNGEWELL